jgi:hypothetical protein
MKIYEHRAKDPLFEFLFECMDRDERNKVWENITGFEYEKPIECSKCDAVKELIKRMQMCLDDDFKNNWKTDIENWKLELENMKRRWKDE